LSVVVVVVVVVARALYTVLIPGTFIGGTARRREGVVMGPLFCCHERGGVDVGMLDGREI